MKTSVNWLRDYIDIPWQPAQLAEELTMAGLEVEGIVRIGELPQDVVIAEILERHPHPNADKLSLCLVNDGSDEPLQVVCGAPNCDAGKKAVLARVGVTLPAAGFTLKKAKIRGEASYGMLCALDELGLGEDHTGIIILPEDAPVGTPYSEYLGTDAVIDWEVTPNRPDWLSHIGIAREIGALTRTSFRLPDSQLPESTDSDVSDLAKVIVEAPDLCPRYTARVIRNVTIGPSPQWMQDHLAAVGLRPINNVVDITNFVMLELGQPLHAFDYDLLAEHTIVVRRAAENETITTLDGSEHKLTPDNLLIADASQGVALAGVMGGQDSEISAKTTHVLLESAAFYAPNIRATAKQLGISTDSSYRFERGIDVEMVETASARAAQLICECAGGELASGMIDVRATPYEPPRVTCRFARVNSLLGVEIEQTEVVEILAALGLEVVEQDDASCTVAVPSFRLDLEREADLIEEIARIYGLNRIPANTSTAKLGGGRELDAFYPHQAFREQLLALGLDECVTNTFTSEAIATRHTGFSEAELATVSNPISSDFAAIRPSLQVMMLQVVAHNVAHDNHDFQLFELGRVCSKRPGEPEEHQACCIVMSGRRHPERHSEEGEALLDYYDLRGRLDALFEARGLEGVVARSAEHPAFRQGVCAELVRQDKVLATLGEVHFELTEDMRIKHPLFMALMNVDLILAQQVPVAVHQPLSHFPATERDIAFAADESLQHQTVIDAITKLKLPNLVKVELFDIFRDEQALGDGRKSMAYSLTFRHPERTLKDKEVNKAYEKLRAKLPETLPIELR